MEEKEMSDMLKEENLKIMEEETPEIGNQENCGNFRKVLMGYMMHLENGF